MGENIKNQTGDTLQACIISAPSAEESLRAARERAAALLCTGEGKRPCGHCRSCRKVQAGIHPDLITAGRLADDRGRLKKEISIDQIRQLRADACILPNEAERKVYIISEADTMNTAAQNAALKLLEEPPNGAVFLLCVKNPQLLLSTVRSRCFEISIGGETGNDGSQEYKLAEEYIGAAASGNPEKLLEWSLKNENIDARQAAAFTEAVSDLLSDMLCGRKDSLGLSRKRIIKLAELAARCGKYLKVNVGVKHIFGLLAVDSIAGTEKEE